MRRAWKMYEKCQNELKASNDKGEYMNGNGEEGKGSLKGTPKKVKFILLWIILFMV